jgi:hypothetical protein
MVELIHSKDLNPEPTDYYDNDEERDENEVIEEEKCPPKTVE